MYSKSLFILFLLINSNVFAENIRFDSKVVAEIEKFSSYCKTDSNIKYIEPNAQSLTAFLNKEWGGTFKIGECKLHENDSALFVITKNPNEARGDFFELNVQFGIEDGKYFLEKVTKSTFSKNKCRKPSESEKKKVSVAHDSQPETVCEYTENLQSSLYEAK